MPVREIARPPRAGSRAARLAAARRARGAGAAAAAGSALGRPLAPSDWRQISAPPLATSTSGQTIASENQMPSAAEREQHAQQQQARAQRHLDCRAARGRAGRAPRRGARPPGSASQPSA